MKKLAVLLVLCLSSMGCVGQLQQWSGVGTNLLKAGTVSENEVKAVSMQFRAQEDATNRVAPENSKYAKRLAKIMAKETSVNGVPLNYKVYISPTVNANATPDGSVRVYSGLMDKMDDDELRFVLGHEIGHVAEGHAMNKMRMSYVTEAARQAVGNINATAATLANSELGEMGKKFINAQYSQSQESSADKYAMQFLKTNHYDTAAAGRALRKLAAMGSTGSGLFDTHPHPLSRADEMDKLARGETTSTSSATSN